MLDRQAFRFLVMLSLACAPQRQDTDTRAAGAEEAGDTAIAVPNALSEGAETQVSRASVLIGNWVLASDPTQPMPGLRITLAIDSARDTEFSGHLLHYFSGNVGADPRQFGSLVGTLTAGSEIALTVPLADPTLPGISIAGHVDGDSIQVTTFVLGPDTLSGRSRTWYLIRRRS